MKITSIDIQEFRQFKNFKLDLTYPKGHEKAGEPLDKVCIIGQSGTGKTSLLELIFNITYDYTQTTNHSNYQNIALKLINSERNELVLNADTILTKKVYDYKLQFKIISFPALYPDSSITIERSAENELKAYLNSFISGDESNIKINFDITRSLWNKRKEELKEHANERSKYIFALSNFVGKLATTEEIIKNKNEISRLKKEKEDWETSNPNPMVDIANLLNPIISKFGLKTRIDIYNLDQLNFIPVMDKAENEVLEQQWSTGTNQIIYKTYPLFALKPENAIILIDEPENSLYPDIQTEIIEHYTRLAPTSQFFFATHSPIIASCFEPWEIVELKFNEDGEIYRDLYYEGENHVDNYKIDPRYLKWDSILKKIFDLNVEGNEAERIPKLMELATLKGEIKAMKENGASKVQLENKLQEIEKLAKLLDVRVKLYEKTK